MVADTRFAMDNTISSGDVPIFDMKGFSLKHITKTLRALSVLRIYMNFTQVCNEFLLSRFKCFYEQSEKQANKMRSLYFEVLCMHFAYRFVCLNLTHYVPWCLDNAHEMKIMKKPLKVISTYLNADFNELRQNEYISHKILIYICRQFVHITLKTIIQTTTRLCIINLFPFVLI